MIERIPRTLERVVWGRPEVMVTFSPTKPLMRVDLPTLGLPITATKPDRISRSDTAPGLVPGSESAIGVTFLIDLHPLHPAALNLLGHQHRLAVIEAFSLHRNPACQAQHQAAHRVPFLVG